MNIDHFYWIDVTDAIQPSSSSFVSAARGLVSSLFGEILPFAREDDMPINARKKEKLSQDLVSDYSTLSKLSKLDLGAFSPIVNVAPSVATVGYPAVRVFTYNVSGLSEDGKESKHARKGVLDDDDDDPEDDEDITRYERPFLQWWFMLICRAEYWLRTVD